MSELIPCWTNRTIVPITLAAGLFGSSASADDSTCDAIRSSALEEIVVTATRREELQQSVPVSIHVATGSELQARGALSFADYARSVPGLSYTDGGTGGEKQTIRGISIDPWFEVNPGTAIHLDEAPITSPGGTSGPPFNPDPVLIDIERIEVLRGPQGTLFGVGSMGGAIRIITRAPDTEEFAAELGSAVTATEDGELGYRLHGIVNSPFNAGRGAFRMVAFQSDPGGYIDNELDGRQNVNNRLIQGARAAASFQLADKVTATVRAMHQDRESEGLSHEEPRLGKRRQSRIPEFVEDTWSNYSLLVEADFGWGSLISSTSLLDRAVHTQADVSFFLGLFFGLDHPLSVVNRERIDEVVQEVRLVSADDDGVGWLIGGFRQRQDQDIGQDFPSPGFDAVTGGLASMFGPADNLFVRREAFSLDQSALYGEVSYRFSDRGKVAMGGRWYEIERDYAADNTGLLFIMGSIQESFSAGDSGFIPKLGVNFDVGDRIALYGNIAEGFRPGGINPPGAIMEPSCAMELQALGFTSTPTSYDSDSLVSFDAGAHITSSRGTGRLSASVFHIDWSDLQTTNFLDCGTGFLQNAGAATSDGIELLYVSRPADAFEYRIGATYTDARLSEEVPNLRAAKGDKLPGVPRITASASATFFFAERSNWSRSFAVDVQYVDDSYMGFNELDSRKLPAYTSFALRFSMETKNWSATAFVNNLFDEEGTVFINDNTLGEWRTTIRPRLAGIGLVWRF